MYAGSDTERARRPGLERFKCDTAIAAQLISDMCMRARSRERERDNERSTKYTCTI